MNAAHNRLVHDTIMAYDRRTSDGTFRYNVMTCFLPEPPTSTAAIEAFVQPTIDILRLELDQTNISRRNGLTSDEIETAIHDGLRFTARVDRFRRTVANRQFGGATSPESPGPRWPAGPMRPGGHRTEQEKIAAKLQ